jgi:hypothetical protein
MADKIHLERVASSNLEAIGYNPHKRILAVQFAKTGIIFHYAGIENALMNRFLEAESFGKFYSQNIRGRFEAERMTGPCEKCGAEGWVGDTCDDCGTGKHQAVPYTPRGNQGTMPTEDIDGTATVEEDSNEDA